MVKLKNDNLTTAEQHKFDIISNQLKPFLIEMHNIYFILFIVEFLIDIQSVLKQQTDN